MTKRKLFFFFKAGISPKEAVETFLEPTTLSRKSMVVLSVIPSLFLLPRVKVLVSKLPLLSQTHLLFRSIFSLQLFPEAPMGFDFPCPRALSGLPVSSPSLPLSVQACEVSGNSLAS